MNLVNITEENIKTFSNLVDRDVACNMDRSFYKGLGVLDDQDEAVGALIYELLDYDSDEDTKSRIHWLKVTEDGAADLLMSAYQVSMKDEEVTESRFVTRDERMESLLRTHGFETKQAQSPDILVTVGDIKKLAALTGGKSLPSYIQSVENVTLVQYRMFLKKTLIKGRFGILEDLSYLPLTWFDREISSCSMADNNIDGILLVRRMPSQTLMPCLFTAFGLDFQKNLGAIMVHSAQKIVEAYPEDVKVLIRRHNAAVKKLTDKFFPQVTGEKVFVGIRREG